MIRPTRFALLMFLAGCTGAAGSGALDSSSFECGDGAPESQDAEADGRQELADLGARHTDVDGGGADGDAGPDADERADGDAGPDMGEGADGDARPDAGGGADGDAGPDAGGNCPSGPWQPELASVHPRLFLAAGDIPLISTRLDAASGIYATLWAGLKARCAQTPPPPATDGTYGLFGQVERSYVSEACAFVALFTPDAETAAAMAMKAAETMAEEFPDPSYINEGLYPKEWYDLYESEVLVAYCSAYDFLAGLGPDVLDPGLLAEARSRLIQRIDMFRKMIHEGATWILLATAQNNHTMKVLGGLGLCAMAVNDRPEAAEDMAEAYSGLHYLLTHFQSVPEGGYAEGWNYLVYGSQTFLHFLVAYHRHADGEPLPYCNPGTLTPGAPFIGEPADYGDVAASETAHNVYRMAVLTASPDGLTTTTDDANPSALQGAVLSWLFDDPVFLWNWRMPAVGQFSNRVEILTLALHDETKESVEPDWPLDASFPEAGFAVMRSSLEEDAILMILQGENGTVMAHGLGHEHPDPTSFLIAAYGEQLVLDPGYINWENHELVMYGKDHNLILVDGKGPPTNLGGYVSTEAFLSDFDPDPWATGVTSATSYVGAGIQRRLARIDASYFVVEDSIFAVNAHSYTWQLNGNGGQTTPESSFTLLDHGARWDRPKASLVVGVAPAWQDAAWSSRPEEHATAWGQWELHDMLTLEAEMPGGEGVDAPGAGFLAIVYPVAASDDATAEDASDPLENPTADASVEPEFTLLEWGDGIVLWEVERATATDYVASNRTIECKDVATPLGPWTVCPGLSIESYSADGELEHSVTYEAVWPCLTTQH